MRVEPITPPDIHHLSAAIGWLELGNVFEANAELGKISPAYEKHTGVLEVRWQICAEQKKWDACLEIAKTMVSAAPDDAGGYIQRSYALRRVEGGGLATARDALLEAASKFPEEPIIPYNLACYECQLGHPNEALALLAKAFAVGNPKSLKLMALNDIDLKPLWSEIERL